LKKRWGAGVRVRIGFRNQYNREPTDEEVWEGVANKEYMSISSDLIRQAFASGKEVSVRTITLL
jgi:predicted nuclease of predicted toxin-antitoxin system